MSSPLWPCRVACWVVLGALTSFPVTDMYQYWDYIIIGAGPAGLQMAHFLHEAGRDYVVFEKNNVSGSFFLEYPRHRRLISINKRFTGKTNREFNLRHDWNSLLSDRDDLLFKEYSKDFFPYREAMLKYLRDFEEKLELDVRHNTMISNISRTDWNTSNNVFMMTDQHGNVFSCRTLFLATGMSVPNVPVYKGIEHVMGYESIPTDPEFYEGKSVLILGHGNSAFETADAIYGHSSLVHVVSRSRVRLAWETHYVGDLRSVNNGLLDTYQLKSLDGVAEGNLRTAEFIRQNDGRVKVVAPSLQEDNFPMRDSYDIVIRCLGFKFDDSIFTESSQPQKRPRGRLQKYPAIQSTLEVEGVPNMYVIGTAAHSVDYRKSAGGFIHGFRYMVRALHHTLEWTQQGVQWPSQTIPITGLLTACIKRINEASGIYQMFGVLGDVIILKDDGTDVEYLEEFPLQQLPHLSSVSGHAATRILVMVMQYGANYSGPGKDIFHESRAIGIVQLAHLSNFLHPVFYYYETMPSERDMLGLPPHTLPRPTRIHHVIEDFLTTWTSPIAHLRPLRLFLQAVTGNDLRDYFHTTCFELAMLHQSIPIKCQKHYLKGQGLAKPHRKNISVSVEQA